jgi:hypothetical protein
VAVLREGAVPLPNPLFLQVVILGERNCYNGCDSSRLEKTSHARNKIMLKSGFRFSHLVFLCVFYRLSGAGEVLKKDSSRLEKNFARPKLNFTKK